jgi:hypothetical protein
VPQGLAVSEGAAVEFLAWAAWTDGIVLGPMGERRGAARNYGVWGAGSVASCG